ncbi:hypothetical protein N7490_010318 [Penicillium lividum]|nr:hypothetical protein N7490_010318 [Penicillium lividum]
MAHRPTAIIPSKRKDDENSDYSSPTVDSAPSRASPNGALTLAQSRSKLSRTSTPKPRILDQDVKINVVIPSPSVHQKRVLVGSHVPSMGLSEKRYPTISIEKRRAAKRAYPKRNEVDRSIVSLSMWSEYGPESHHPSPAALLRANLNEKLKLINGPAITFNIDDEQLAMLSATFGFVNDYVLLDGVTRVDEGFNSGCNCIGPCDPTACDCLFEEEDSDKKIPTYQIAENGQIVLRSSFLERRSKIVECCDLCSCKGKCWNTAVQRGRQVRFEIFDTGARGCGIRSPDPIMAGQFIDRYLGEVILQDEADARELANQKGQSYLFALDWKIENPEDGDPDDESFDDDFYVIDGQKFGSPTRFINHSCNPNCKIVPVSTTEHGDENLYHLAFFAMRDISPGTELTFDYNPFWDGTKKIDPHAVKCLCGEDNCRGQLWPNARKQGPGRSGL